MATLGSGNGLVIRDFRLRFVVVSSFALIRGALINGHKTLLVDVQEILDPLGDGLLS